jgi:D-cysteine desulfhydrase
LIGAPTPLEYLPRLSDHLGAKFLSNVMTTPLAMGGNKLRKLEFLAADALREGADTLITAGAIQSNHVRQTAAVAANWACTAWRCWKIPSAPVRRTI